MGKQVQQEIPGGHFISHYIFHVGFIQLFGLHGGKCSMNPLFCFLHHFNQCLLWNATPAEFCITVTGVRQMSQVLADVGVQVADEVKA